MSIEVSEKTETESFFHPFEKSVSYDLTCFDAKTAVNKFQAKTMVEYREVQKIHKKLVKIDEKEKIFSIPEFGPVKKFSYLQFWDLVQSFGDGLVKLSGVKEHEKVGILMETRFEWLISAHASWRHGIVPCSCYATLGIEGIKEIIKETEINTIIVERSKIKILEEIQKDIPNLKNVIYCEELFPGEQKDLPEDSKFNFVSFDEVIQLGKENKVSSPYKSTRDDILSVMYTSGTTGKPKGVIMTNNTYVNMTKVAQYHANFTDNDRFLGYLPMAHIMENAFETTSMLSGCVICYGTPRTLTDQGAKPKGDFTTYKPTICLGVPRVFETIRKKIMTKVNKSKFSKSLFQMAFDYKNKYMLKKETTPITDALMFKKIQNLFGGNLKILLSGGAPLSQTTHSFLQTILYPNCFFTQAFGATETSGVGLARGWEMMELWKKKPYQTHNIYKSTSDCGWPKLGAEIKLRSVPEMNYFVTDEVPKGEILIRGPTVSPGYFKREAKNKETFLDGWYVTGDICQKNPNGTFTIIDRKKNLMKMQNGEFVSPESLESDYSASYFIAPNGLVIIANPYSNFIIAIVCPSKDHVQQWATENNITKSFEDMVASEDKKLKKAILADFLRISKETKKLKVEIIKDIIFSKVEFTIENGLINSTQKLKRNSIKEYFKGEIESTYKELDK